MGSLPPPYRFFQTAIVWPDDESGDIAASPPAPSSLNDIDVSVIDPKLLGAAPATAQTLAASSSVVEVLVRITPKIQRAWFIRNSVISRHSADLRAACEHASTVALDLDGDTFSFAAFQNFIDFCHSSIYSVNKNAADYGTIHTHVQSWLLGVKLEAPTYQAAALQELYTWIEPLSRAINSSAVHSPIRIEDVDFVCRKSPKDCVMRALIFDAVAAHWTQHDTITISANVVRKFTRGAAPEPDARPDQPPALTWSGLYNKHRDFRKRMSSSLKVHDSQRTRLLRPVEDYIAGETGIQEEEFVDEAAVSSLFGGRRSPRPRLTQGGLTRSPGRKRRSSSHNGEGSQRGRSKERHVDEDEFMTLEDA